jgi:hypothetical protein
MGRSKIVTIACPSTIVPLVWFERLSERVSAGSTTVSELIVTKTVLVRSCGANVNVPDVAT